MLASIVLAVAGFAVPAIYADSDGNSLVLLDKPCDKAVLNLLKDEFHSLFKGATYRSSEGETMQACWSVPTEHPLIYVHFADNDHMTLRIDAFKSKSTGI